MADNANINKNEKPKDDENDEDVGCCTKCCQGYEACIIACCKVKVIIINKIFKIF